MYSGLFKLYSNDFVKGLATAVFAAVVVILGNIVTAPGFDVFTVDWYSVGHSVLNTSTVTFVAYLIKNFLSTDSGSVLAITPNDKPSY